jgi:aspartyl-tRNA(Asn)/glutamyl-tRNA(Gln) amidotransferase subunit A
VIAGHDEFDSTVSTQPVETYSSNLSSEKKFKVAYLRETLESEGLQQEIKDSLSTAVQKMKAAGHTVEAIDFPLMEYFLPTYYILVTAEASSNLARFDGVRYGHRSEQTTDLQSLYKKTRAEGFGKEVQKRILLGTFSLSSNYYDAYYTKAQKVRRIIRNKTKDIFKEYDFLVMPTTPATARKLGEKSTNPVGQYLGDVFSVQANVAGVPGISIPYGTDKKGLPIGLQIIANDFEESKLFQFSEMVLNMN